MPPPLGLQAEQLSLRGSHGLRCGNVRWAETSRESGENGLTRIATNSGIGLAFLLNKLLPTLTFTDFLKAYSPLWYPSRHWNSFRSNGLTLWLHCFSRALHHPNMSGHIKTHSQLQVIEMEPWQSHRMKGHPSARDSGFEYTYSNWLNLQISFFIFIFWLYHVACRRPPTRDRTQAPCIGSRESTTTRSPGNSPISL